MKKLLFLILLIISPLALIAQDRPDSLSLKTASETEELIYRPAFPSTIFNAIPEITISPRSKPNMLFLIDLKAEIARNVYNFREMFHFIPNSNRYFLTSLMPGLVPDIDVGPNPEFNYSIFADPNFDQRVYNPGGIYSKTGSIVLPKSTFLNTQIFQNGYNPTDKINW